MKFGEKLSRLTADENKAKIARAADLPTNAINDYIKKGHTPRADNALALAKALNVPLDWLVDDNADWPPPKPKKESPEQFGTEAILRLVATWQRRGIVTLLESMDHLKDIDWSEISKSIEGASQEEVLNLVPSNVVGELATLRGFQSLVEGLNPERFAAQHHDEMPGADRPLSDFTEFRGRFSAMWKNEHLSAAASKIFPAMDRHLAEGIDLMRDVIFKEDPSLLSPQELAKVSPSVRAAAHPDSDHKSSIVASAPAGPPNRASPPSPPRSPNKPASAPKKKPHPPRPAADHN